MKCASFRWIDPEWDIRSLKFLEKLMELGKAEGKQGCGKKHVQLLKRRSMSKKFS
jgi:hypothetical protein